MSTPTGLTIHIDSFDNAAMADEPETAVADILRELADKIEATSLRGMSGTKLRDYNGNVVGSITVGFE